MNESQAEIYELRARVSRLEKALQLAYDYEIMDYDNFLDKYPNAMTKGYQRIIAEVLYEGT